MLWTMEQLNSYNSNKDFNRLWVQNCKIIFLLAVSLDMNYER